MSIESTGSSTPRVSEGIAGELLPFFRALADMSRLKIIGLLAQRAYPVEQISAMLDLSPSTVSHHLSKLSEAGLVSARAQGHYSLYSLEGDAVFRMARRLLRTERLVELAGGVDTSGYDRKVLASFIGPDGRFTSFPAQEKKYLVLLRHVLREFRPGIRYSEREMNAILKRYSDDTARLRRSLVEYGFMEREGGGRDYWLKDPAPAGETAAS
jgi:biotin operon repressor